MKKKSMLLVVVTVLSVISVLVGCDILPSKNAFLSVVNGACFGCGECIKVCEGDAIILLGNKAVIDPSKCIRCGRCVKVCPNDAIH